MLQIKEYDFSSLDSSKIDVLIKKKLKELEDTNQFTSFFSCLNKILNSESNFSFLKASHETIKKLVKINTHINVDEGLITNLKADFKTKKYYTLNDLLEIILGYHLESRTQFVKRFLKSNGLNNCVYCLAQYTTTYIGKANKKEKIYIKGNLDHIYPKSKNALVSLCINNLVPVCGHCNQRKLDGKEDKFDFNPFNKIDTQKYPTFNFADTIQMVNGIVEIKDLSKLKVDHINAKLETRLNLTKFYTEYNAPIKNLLDRYKKFNSPSYSTHIKELLGMQISDSIEYFISEIPFTEENIQNIPLHKFKSDFYKELEGYKTSGKNNST